MNMEIAVSLVLMTVVAGLILFIFLAAVLALVDRGSSSLRFAPVFVIAGISLSLIRMASYWALFYMARTGQEDISYLPLAFLLFPEGKLLPESGERTTVVQGILFSGLLAIGSFLWAAILGWSMRRRARRVS